MNSRGGFVQNINAWDKASIIQLGNDLETGNWIDEKTRVIFVT